MTAAPAPVAPPQPKPSARAPRRASPTLWALALAVTIPGAAPIVHLVWTVLRPGGFDAGGISFGRLAQLFGSTSLLVATVTISALALGTATAWLTTRTDIAGRGWWSMAVTLPLVIPSYVGALAMLGSSGNAGLVSLMLDGIGLPKLPVFSGFWAAWGALTLWNFSYVHLITSPALARMDPSLEEAARGLGASARRTVVDVVLPQLRPALLSSSLLVALYVISDFGAVSLLRYETFTRAIYTQFRGRLEIAPSLFLSGILVLAALVLVVAEQRNRGRASLASRRPSRPPRRVILRGGRRLGAYAFLGTVVTASLVLPLVTLGWWAVQGTSLGNVFAPVWTEAGRSAGVASAAAVATALAALPVAILTVRHPSRSARMLEAVSWSTYSLPHLAVGLGFLVLSIRYAPALYQSVLLLVIAYVAMFLPQALAATQAGLRQVGTSLEEASRSLGSSGAATLRRVVIPLVWRSILAGAALVFLTVMKELPATLLLRPTGFETLAVRIWSASSELFYTQASVAALVLVGISAIPLYLLVRDR
ncbi:MAG TPA: iron ABC transporter permease [Acidimicrobiia bacterium]|nr:iron ABC transporter permease [Acidimicrobiia bacterium]